ncbi:ubiquitin-like-specific protease ESD4 isoform X1 [Nicotiana tabacum]|uniref:Ubiquitin-like-specific protease ESD4 isoform X1 n=2 Tax=Nicotiana tabacum TaxID=4097 RepID=A0AC58SKQ9_TOBAC|nr:ubiquitin-like-specific protease ESD4 isoform X2 [Nicotiana tomentosiformis]
MGALTSNRKRGDDFFTLNYKTPASNVDPHISKKPRLSMNQTTQDHSKTSTVKRLFIKYPSSITSIKREIHAPCKRPSSSRFGGGSHSIMGNFLVQQLYRAKSSAFKTFRYLKKKDKQVVINVDGDDEDSHVEELGTGFVPKTGLFDGSGQIRKESNAKMGLSNGSGGRWKVSDGVIEILDNSDDGVVTDVQLQSSSVVTVSDGDVNLLKVENAEKMMDSLSLSNSKFDDSSSSASFVPSYKKLLDSAEKRNDNLKSLQFHIQYTEKLLETYKLLRPQKKDEQYVKEDVIIEPFVQLDKEEKAEVSHALSNYSRSKVLVTHENSNIDITGEILQCLRPRAWLNDEVINVYLELLKEREKREPKRFLRCHFFNTFFYKKLISGKGGYNYQSVKRWTSQRKLGYCLFECDKIFVPIHQEVHWCLAVINKKDEKFQYLDSLGGRDNQVLRVLTRYFIDEVKDKNGKDIDVSSWKQEFVVDLPEQENGFDCGMFMLKYADFYSRDIGLCFNQEHMPYFRLRTAKEILRLKAE